MNMDFIFPMLVNQIFVILYSRERQYGKNTIWKKCVLSYFLLFGVLTAQTPCLPNGL